MTDTTTVQPSPQPAVQPPLQPAAASTPAPAEPVLGTQTIPGPGHAPAPDAPFFALPRRWNPLALAAFAAAFIAPVVGIVFGHLALRDLRWNGERGQRLAFWGLVLGYVFSALIVIGGVVAIIAAAHHGTGAGRFGGGFPGQGGFGTGGGTGNGGGFGSSNGFPGQGYGGGTGTNN